MHWALKISAKVVLSRLAVPYDLWRKLGLFRHGKMDSFDYALKVFRLHLDRAVPGGDLTGKSILEIGPGDSLASAVIGRAFGAERIVLVDVCRFASAELDFYRSLADALAAEGFSPPDLSAASDLDGVLAACGAEYLTEGVASFAKLADGSIDYAWSHSVLEHIPKDELPRLMAELHRVLTPAGVMSHNIDFQDHLAHSLNSLRFSERAWEAPLMRDAGFYTNRVRALQMHGLIRAAGFEIVQEGFGRWPALPVPREALDRQFRGLSEDELLIRTSHLLARPGPIAAAQ